MTSYGVEKSFSATLSVFREACSHEDRVTQRPLNWVERLDDCGQLIPSVANVIVQLWVVTYLDISVTRNNWRASLVGAFAHL